MKGEYMGASSLELSQTKAELLLELQRNGVYDRLLSAYTAYTIEENQDTGSSNQRLDFATCVTALRKAVDHPELTKLTSVQAAAFIIVLDELSKPF